MALPDLTTPPTSPNTQRPIPVDGLSELVESLLTKNGESTLFLALSGLFLLNPEVGPVGSLLATAICC